MLRQAVSSFLIALQMKMPAMLLLRTSTYNSWIVANSAVCSTAVIGHGTDVSLSATLAIFSGFDG